MHFLYSHFLGLVQLLWKFRQPIDFQERITNLHLLLNMKWSVYFLFCILFCFCIVYVVYVFHISLVFCILFARCLYILCSFFVLGIVLVRYFSIFLLFVWHMVFLCCAYYFVFGKHILLLCFSLQYILCLIRFLCFAKWLRCV